MNIQNIQARKKSSHTTRMPLNRKTGPNKRVRVTSTRFDDTEESYAVKKNTDLEDDEDVEDEQVNVDSGDIISDKDISDDELEDSDKEENEDEILERLQRVNIESGEGDGDAEQYYSKLVKYHAQNPDIALDYDYQEADEDEYMQHAIISKDQVAVFNPKRYRLAEDEELEFSNSAYTFFHRLDVDWPCLSLSLINDEMGIERTQFPMSQYVACGTQADEKSKNRLYIMKMSNLRQTQYDSDEDRESSDDEDNVSSTFPSKDPILEHSYYNMNAEINKLKVMPQDTKYIAAMCADASLAIFNVETQLQILSRDSRRPNMKSVTPKTTPLQVLTSHSNEGFALDWSSVQKGRIGSGDFNATICVHDMLPDGQWKLLNRYNRHKKSVEDVQWSPNEANVFASASCDGNVLIWDTRVAKKEGLAFQVSTTDVNCIAWNKLKQNLIASGDDDGIINVWDMKTIGSNNGTPQSIARFTYLEGEHVTSMEWHPFDESVLLVSTDDRVTIWDLSVEKDTEELMQENENGDDEIPEQLLFEHYGRSIKDAHWSVNLKDAVMCTGEMGIQIWRPANVFDASLQE